MIKVFLVEDEVIMRNGIKKNIPWEQKGFEFAGEASDGELAYPLIKKVKPDILITDIKMPFMDGLELSALVKKEMPSVKIIILSGYDEFDYAKQAISIGVTEYLLKPISSEKLLEAVEKVGEVIRQERENQKLVEQYQKEMQENLQSERSRLFNSVVKNQLTLREALERGQELGLDFISSYYNIVLIKWMMPENDDQYSKIAVAGSEQLMTLMEEETEILIFERGTEGWSFLIKGESPEEIQTRTLSVQNKLEEIRQQIPDFHYFAGVGETVQRLGDLQKSLRAASKAFACRFFVEQDQFVRHDRMEEFTAIHREEMDLESLDSGKIDRTLVDHFLKKGVVEEVDDFVEEYFLRMGQSNYRSMIFRQYIVIDMFFCVSTFLESIGMHTDQLSESCRSIKDISAKISSVDKIKTHLKELLQETLQLRDSQSSNRYLDLIDEAKTYIREHFSDNGLSLNSVANNINMSPSYFSSVFRQETGQTFVEYLTEVRLEKAKELLMCTNKKTVEISYDVGYKDSHYFSYIFKKTQGCTPREYRSGKREA